MIFLSSNSNLGLQHSNPIHPNVQYGEKRSTENDAAAVDHPADDLGEFASLTEYLGQSAGSWSDRPTNRLNATDYLPVESHMKDHDQATLELFPPISPPMASNLFQSIEMTPSMEGFDVSRPFSSSKKSRDASVNESPREASFYGVDLDWPSLRLPTIAFFDEDAQLQENLSSNADTGRSKRSSAADLGRRKNDICKDFSLEGPHSMQKQVSNAKGDQCIWLNDNDAKAAIRPLQLMEQHLQMSSDHSRLQWNRSDGSTIHHLYNLLKSRCISVQLDQLLLQTYEASARAQRRKITNRKTGPDSGLGQDSENLDHSIQTMRTDRALAQRERAIMEKKVKVTSYWLSVWPQGTLSVRLKTAGRESSITQSSQPLWVLSITSMPKASGRTNGLTAQFVSPFRDDDSPSIPPCISTINLVPEDSEIIRCISRNDVSNVKRIFGMQEASPQDLDPYGFSLLSVSHTSLDTNS